MKSGKAGKYSIVAALRGSGNGSEQALGSTLGNTTRQKKPDADYASGFFRGAVGGGTTPNELWKAGCGKNRVV
ncbi:hypothetical protein [Paenibacillus sp. P46E]|uniref:hypothetical protein n=1 Tax=Paenibacillus sp. P46E TaxID=1349436 RepID=UPI001160F9F3|nr:hypothetical protein [Paenibacillus sp. P46E]